MRGWVLLMSDKIRKKLTDAQRRGADHIAWQLHA